MKAPNPSAAVLDTPRYKVTVLPAECLEGNGLSASQQDVNGGAVCRQAEAVRAAYEFSRLEAAAAGIAAQHDIMAEPLSGSISGMLIHLALYSTAHRNSSFNLTVWSSKRSTAVALRGKLLSR